MLTGWVTNLDYLANNGVIDYDAAADVAGFQPRYIGSPPDIYAYNPFPEGVPEIRKQPAADGLAPKYDEPFASPDWKKWLFIGICGATLVFGGYKLSRLFPALKKAGSGTKNFFGKCGTKIKDFFAGGWRKIKNAFK